MTIVFTHYTAWVMNEMSFQVISNIFCDFSLDMTDQQTEVSIKIRYWAFFLNLEKSVGDTKGWTENAVVYFAIVSPG